MDTLSVEFLLTYKKPFNTVNHEILLEKSDHYRIKSKKTRLVSIFSY